jgi:hypothetical protein
MKQVYQIDVHQVTSHIGSPPFPVRNEVLEVARNLLDAFQNPEDRQEWYAISILIAIFF